MSISVTELRANLQKYIDQVEKGIPLDITVRGKVVVRMVPAADRQAEAKKWLRKARRNSWLGDVESPIKAKWEADWSDNP